MSGKSVIFRLPSAVVGGQFATLFTEMGFTSERGVHAGEWILREAVSARRWSGNRLVEARTLAAPWLRETRFDLLKPPPQDLDEPAVTDAEVSAEFANAVRRMREPHTLAPLLYAAQLGIATASDADLHQSATHQYEMLGSVKSGGSLAFPNLAATWVSTNLWLYNRYRLPAIAMRFEQDPDFVARIRAGSVIGGEGPIFASNEAIGGRGLLDGTYLGPLLSCTAPDVWAVHGQRLSNTVIYVLGQAITGVDSMPAEPLQLLPRQTPMEHRDRIVPTTPQAWIEAIDWWVTKLNQMFGYLSDPTTFADANGYYLPYQQQNWMLNAEELFNRTSTAMMAWRDSYSAQIATYTALDLVSEGFLGGNMSDLCNPKRAQKALDSLEATMPDTVQQVLLPRARAAVNALSRIADGFFISKSRGSSTVDIVDDQGAIESLEIGQAVQAVMRGRRNATHGFGGKNNNGAARTSRILAHHNGALPDELAFLPYLYLLLVLNEPENRQNRIKKVVK